LCQRRGEYVCHQFENKSGTHMKKVPFLFGRNMQLMFKGFTVFYFLKSCTNFSNEFLNISNSFTTM
jgi:hypothetical protein